MAQMKHPPISGQSYLLLTLAIFLGVASFETFFHSYLHSEGPGIDGHHLIAGLTTAISSICIVVVLVRENIFLFNKISELHVREKGRVAITQQEWERTFDSLSDFVSVHDKNLIVQKANKALCDFMGKSRKEIIGKHCYELFHGQDHPWENCPHVKAIALNQSVSEEINDPNIGVPVLVTCSPYYDEKEEILGTVHVARPITDKNITEEQKDVELKRLNEIAERYKSLSGFMTICSYCRNIREGDGEWLRVEEYIGKHAGGTFSHGICEDCFDKEYKKITEC